MSRIEQLADQLTNEQYTMINSKQVSSPSLLQALKDSIFQGTERGSGSSGFGSRSLVGTAAFALFDQIEREVAALHVGMASCLDVYGREQGLLGMFWEAPPTESVSDPEPTELTARAAEAFTRAKPRVFPLTIQQAIWDWVRDLHTDEQTELATLILERWVKLIRRCLGLERKIDYYGIVDPDTGKTTAWVNGRLQTALFAVIEAGSPVVHSRATGRTWSTEKEIRDLRFSARVDTSV